LHLHATRPTTTIQTKKLIFKLTASARRRGEHGNATSAVVVIVVIARKFSAVCLPLFSAYKTNRASTSSVKFYITVPETILEVTRVVEVILYYLFLFIFYVRSTQYIAVATIVTRIEQDSMLHLAKITTAQVITVKNYSSSDLCNS